MTDAQDETGANPDDTSVFFTDGFVVRHDAIIIPTQFQDSLDTTLSRILFLFGDKWGYHDFHNADIGSVTYREGLCYLMGMNGVVHSCGRTGVEFSPNSLKDSYRETVVADVPSYGALFRIRFIGEDVYACGQSSQVYVLRGQEWKHMDDGILKLGGITLVDLDGTGPDDIYAVGMEGSIFHYDGKQWTLLDSPTNQHLTNVRCISRDEVYICGYSGTLLQGSGDTWRFVGDTNFRENFWGMAAFERDIYLSYKLGIMKYDGKELASVDLGFDVDRTLSCKSLHGSDGVLWSFGDEELLRFDGVSWEQVVCPENR